MNVQDYAKVSPDLAIRLQVPPAKKKKRSTRVEKYEIML